MICPIIQIILATTNILVRKISTIISNPLKHKNKKNYIKKTINEVLFYSDDDPDHMRMIGLGNIFCIYYVIFKSKRTIDVCVPRLSSDALAKCLVKVQQQNGSKTRIIIHKSNDLRNLQLFTLNKIEVKLIKSEVRLEHEFIVIDSSEPNAMILLGNVCCGGCWDKMECFNKAPTILSSEKSLVGAMKQEFDRIWNSESY